MITNALVETHIDSNVKDEATKVLATMGLTISDAIRLMLIKIAQDHKLPFDEFIPNAETVKAMEEARAGQLQTTETIEQLMVAMKL
ncbi:MAG: type II toxin-antitoxin system RelB/DinJ family antitoxin [Methylococcales bacterium]|nr:type II toxin-antitoxin system RelB/DinJ family antitoxin [Methylococcales bacterium]MDP3838407.1 type II toxin-antitoxin system RelB/DinJ family antitoxin [Methylococcales bacterium]